GRRRLRRKSPALLADPDVVEALRGPEAVAGAGHEVLEGALGGGAVSRAEQAGGPEEGGVGGGGSGPAEEEAALELPPRAHVVLAVEGGRAAAVEVLRSEGAAEVPGRERHRRRQDGR